MTATHSRIFLKFERNGPGKPKSKSSSSISTVDSLGLVFSSTESWPARLDVASVPDLVANALDFLRTFQSFRARAPISLPTTLKLYRQKELLHRSDLYLCPQRELTLISPI